MRAMLAFLVSAKIGTQIAVLVVGALVLAHVAMAAAFLTLHPIRPEQNRRLPPSNGSCWWHA